MRYSLGKFVAAAWGAFTCMAVFGTPPAAASAIYAAHYVFGSHCCSYATNTITGTITTDGTFGVLTPANILGWDLSVSAGAIIPQ